MTSRHHRAVVDDGPNGAVAGSWHNPPPRQVIREQKEASSRLMTSKYVRLTRTATRLTATQYSTSACYKMSLVNNATVDWSSTERVNGSSTGPQNLGDSVDGLRKLQKLSKV